MPSGLVGTANARFGEDASGDEDMAWGEADWADEAAVDEEAVVEILDEAIGFVAAFLPVEGGDSSSEEGLEALLAETELAGAEEEETSKAKFESESSRASSREEVSESLGRGEGTALALQSGENQAKV